MTRTHLFEAANAIMTRVAGAARLREWARAIAERTGPRKAKVALARKLAVILHAMWRSRSDRGENRGAPYSSAHLLIAINFD